jgi:hypothetical protein
LSNGHKSMAEIKATELPYLSHVPVDGRSIPILPFFDSDAQKFYTYIKKTDGKILVIPCDPMESIYISKNQDRETDSRLPLYEIIIQSFSFKEVFSALLDAGQDLMNGLASLHKYFVLLDYAYTSKDLSYSRMIQTEIEYAFINHRAFYDCLNKIVHEVHKRYKADASKLPNSFARIVEGKSENELEHKHLLPRPLINYYKTRKDVFLKMRNIRGKIIHSGKSLDFVFMAHDGFMIRVDEYFVKYLGDMHLWPDNLLKPNRMGSILAILEFLTRDIFDAMEQLGKAFINSFPNPPQPIATGYHVFLRSPISKHLANLNEYRQRHWFDPKKVLEDTIATENKE